MPDNYTMWGAHEREQERRLARLPVCTNCGEPIQGERAWRINGNLWCEECAEDEFKVWTEDYIR